MLQQQMPQSRRNGQQPGKLPGRRNLDGSRQSKRKAQGTVGNTKDIERRLSTVEQRLDWLDQNGTRGMQVLQVQLTEQTKDIADNTARLATISAQIDAMGSARRQQITTIALALLPIYVLLFMSLFHVTPA